MDAYRDRHGISRRWETRERVVVAVSSASGGEQLVRRAARLAQRSKGDLIGVHVHSASGLAGDGDDDDSMIESRRRCCSTSSAASYREVTSSDVAAGLVQVARSENATQIVLGASGRSRWHELWSGSVVNDVIRKLSGDIDVHVISTRPTADEPRSAGRRCRAPRRLLDAALPHDGASGDGCSSLDRTAVVTIAFANSRDAFGLDQRAAALPAAGRGRGRGRRRRARRRRRCRRLPARQLVLHAAVSTASRSPSGREPARARRSS